MHNNRNHSKLRLLRQGKALRASTPQSVSVDDFDQAQTLSDATSTDVSARVQSKPVAKKSSGVLGFFVITVSGIVMAALAAYLGSAPLTSPFFEDWKDWAGLDTTATGMLLLGIVVFMLGFIGIFAKLFSSTRPQSSRSKTIRPHAVRPVLSEDAPVTKDEPPVATKEYHDTSAEPSEMTETTSRRGALVFDAESLSAEQDDLNGAAASDTSQMTAEAMAKADGPFSLVPHDHLKVADQATASQASDLIGQNLLAEAPDPVVSPTPEADIKAVTASALKFIDQNDQAPAVEAAPVASAPMEASVAATVAALAAVIPDSSLAAPVAEIAPVNPVDRLKSVHAKALAQWPEETREIASTELNSRLEQLLQSQDPRAVSAFEAIESGDLNGASAQLQHLADDKAVAGHSQDAAEIWRAYGALHMGRDDPKAMMAYEKISSLDAKDANIHLFLAERYRLEDRYEARKTMLQRALGTITAPEVRGGLLQQLGDLSLSHQDLDGAARAFSELCDIQQGFCQAEPDNLHLVSSQAISWARLAQIRELQGQKSMASQFYGQAHRLFADLSQKIPEHAGLKAMAENALRDAQRLSV